MIGFMFAALGLMYYGWNIFDEEKKLILFGMSLLFWFATAGQFVFDNSESNAIVITWIFIFPILYCSVKILEFSLGSLERTEKNLGKY